MFPWLYHWSLMKNHFGVDVLSRFECFLSFLGFSRLLYDRETMNILALLFFSLIEEEGLPFLEGQTFWRFFLLLVLSVSFESLLSLQDDFFFVRKGES